MSQNNDQIEKQIKNGKKTNKFVQHTTSDKLSSVVNAVIKSESDDNSIDVTETNAMRVLLPAFIQNEQKYSEMDRIRKIQSSPMKSTQRRFSQDSAYLDRQWNVSYQ